MKRFSFITFMLLLAATPAHAMHISEGILPLPWAVLWFAVAAPFVAVGLKRLNELSRDDLSMKPLVGLMAAVVFVISCMPIPVPTAGTCSHPCGTGIAAILVGPFVSVVISTVALLIQALVMAHGGLSTLGADIVSMGVVGSFVGWLTFRGMRRLNVPLAMAAFAAGLLTDWATYLTTSVELASGIRGTADFWPLVVKIVGTLSQERVASDAVVRERRFVDVDDCERGPIVAPHRQGVSEKQGAIGIVGRNRHVRRATPRDPDAKRPTGVPRRAPRGGR